MKLYYEFTAHMEKLIDNEHEHYYKRYTADRTMGFCFEIEDNEAEKVIKEQYMYANGIKRKKYEGWDRINHVVASIHMIAYNLLEVREEGNYEPDEDVFPSNGVAFGTITKVTDEAMA